ncbi:MAG TPA: hypothetical protein VM238_19395 [Phycisphaerae bacterium]|nr:hypothetical protein [Phycisphaerae bacterium]
MFATHGLRENVSPGRGPFAERGQWCLRLLAGALALACVALWPPLAAGAEPAAPAAGGGGANAARDDAAKPGEGKTADSPTADAARPTGTGTATTVPAGEGRIELHIKGDDLTNVLELLSQQYQLNIVASKGATGKVSADLYNVTVEEALDAICRATTLQWVREGNCIYVHTAEELAVINQDEARLVNEVFPLNYLTSDEALKVITPVLSKKATTAVTTAAEAGIPSGAEEVGGDNYAMCDALVVRDFPENIEEVRKILERMDKRPRQVLVEATILSVTLDDSTNLGINFNALAGVDFRNIAAPQPTTLPATIQTNAAGTADAAQNPWGTFYTSGFATPGNGLNIGVMTNNVSFFINALEDVTDTTVLSNPKVLTLNKQPAEVIVGQEIGYITTTVSETTAVQAVEFLEVGTQLRFRPFITDKGYVRLEVHPEISTGVINPITQVPDKTTTEVTCNILVKDGETVVIGGLFDETASITRSQVPGLGNIPGLGWLFRSKDDVTLRHEIIVLLTPHIIEDNELDAGGKATIAEAKRRCLGLREGFSFFTRERITVGHMQKADEAWKQYERTKNPKDLDDARWNVLLACNVAPNNLKALRLKDKVLTAKAGQPYTPPNLTVWDSIQDRLRAIDKAKGIVSPGPMRRPKEAPAPSQEPETKDKAPATGKVNKKETDRAN